MSTTYSAEQESRHAMDARGDRRATPTSEPGPRVERIDDGWLVRSARVAREVLQQGDLARQAGFSKEAASASIRGSLPLLYNFGESHRHQRSMVARYFTPKAVERRYRDLMRREVDRAVADISTGRPVRVDVVTMRYSVAVAREVVGLTNSTVEGLAWRLNQFFGVDVPRTTFAGRLLFQTVALIRLGVFYIWDVRPAIAERRRNPSEDVVSHLVEEGHTDSEILTEAITYAAAGMVTTREFITLALWHFLENAPLRERYLTADEPERYAILHELLRLEPVVGALYRRMAGDVKVTDEGREYTFAEGEKVTVSIRDSNVDEFVVGRCPIQLQPGRDMPKGFKPDVIGFGEGPHRCPGAFLAIQESDMLLRALLALPLEIVDAPDVRTDPLIQSLVLRGMRVRFVD